MKEYLLDALALISGLLLGSLIGAFLVGWFV